MPGSRLKTTSRGEQNALALSPIPGEEASAAREKYSPNFSRSTRNRD